MGLVDIVLQPNDKGRTLYSTKEVMKPSELVEIICCVGAAALAYIVIVFPLLVMGKVATDYGYPPPFFFANQHGDPHNWNAGGLWTIYSWMVIIVVLGLRWVWGKDVSLKQ